MPGAPPAAPGPSLAGSLAAPLTGSAWSHGGGPVEVGHTPGSHPCLFITLSMEAKARVPTHRPQPRCSPSNGQFQCEQSRHGIPHLSQFCGFQVYHLGFNQGSVTSRRFMYKTDTPTHTRRYIHNAHMHYILIPTHIYIQVPPTHAHVDLTQELGLPSCRGWLSKSDGGRADRQEGTIRMELLTHNCSCHPQLGSVVPPPPHLLLSWESLHPLLRALD